MCHFNKATCARGDSQQHGGGPSPTMTKGVLYGVAGGLAKERQSSSEVWADLANSQNSGPNTSSDSDFLCTCLRVAESVNWPSKSCINLFFSIETDKKLTKLSTPTIRQACCEEGQLQQKQQQHQQKLMGKTEGK